MTVLPAAETQDSISSWADETFGEAVPRSPSTALRLLEEAVELCWAAGADGFDVQELVEASLCRCATKPRGRTHVAKEIGDVGVTLFRAASVYGCDAMAQVDAVMRTNRGRTWVKNGDGTGQHVGG